MNLDNKPVTKGAALFYKRHNPNGFTWKPATVVEVHSAMPVLKVIHYTGSGKTNADKRAKVEWIKLADCAWSEPKPTIEEPKQ